VETEQLQAPSAVEEPAQSGRGLKCESAFDYRSLFHNNPQPMWVFDRETLRFLAVNDAAIRE